MTDVLNPEWCAEVDHAARDTLAAMLAGHNRCAVRELNHAQHLGHAAYVRMMLGWIDTLLHHLDLPAEVDRFDLVFATTDLTRIAPDAVSSSSRWAGKLIAARAVLDHDACEALVRAEDGYVFGERVTAVLTGVAATLRHHPDSALAAQLRTRHLGGSTC